MVEGGEYIDTKLFKSIDFFEKKTIATLRKISIKPKSKILSQFSKEMEEEANCLNLNKTI